MRESLVSIAVVPDSGVELVDYSPHSLGLAPSDDHVFPNLTKHLTGNQYYSYCLTVTPLLMAFLMNKMKVSSPIGCKYCNTDRSRPLKLTS